MRLVFDIESNGFLEDMDRVHCINLIEVESGRKLSFNGGVYEDTLEPCPRDGTLEQGLMTLMKADELIGHNIIKFDIPGLKKVYPFFKPKAKITDTLVCTSVIYTNIADWDHDAIRRGRLPHAFQQAGLIGKHSLEAWGYRIGEFKAHYDGDREGAWKLFTKEMDDYARQDPVANLRLYERIIKKGYAPRCLQLEHDVQRIIARQTERGFRVNMEKILDLSHKLQARRAELECELQQLFPPWKKSLGMFTPKVNNKKMGYVKGVPIERFKDMVFNPGSRDQIAERLMTLKGWNPTVFTASGKPQVDEKVLAELPWPEAKKLTEYLEVAKHLGQVSEGEKSWLTLARQDAKGQWRLHGEVRTNGAVTGRMTHSLPNLAQIPTDHEFRECFIASLNMVLVGCDAEGLELRMLAHYMAKYDGGAYVQTVIAGKKEDKTDVHSVNQRAVGLHSRDSAKTWVYAFLYGAGDFKLGTIVLADMTEEERNAFYTTHTTKRARETAIKRLGSRSRDRMLSGLPALGRLVQKVKRTASSGSLRGLDGRMLHVRGAHSALNTLLQGAGAIVMKQALVLLDDSTGGTVHFVANVHDEFQAECLEEEAHELGRLAADSIRLAGESFGLRCPLSGSYGVGASWAETH